MEVYCAMRLKNVRKDKKRGKTVLSSAEWSLELCPLKSLTLTTIVTNE